MPKFTIETTYLLPIYRHSTVEAETVEIACQLALNDDDWESSKKDYDSCRPTFVSGIWEGEGAAYSGPACKVPPEHVEQSEVEELRASNAELLAALEGMLGDFGPDYRGPTIDRARNAIAKARWERMERLTVSRRPDGGYPPVL